MAAAAYKEIPARVLLAVKHESNKNFDEAFLQN
jgi:hypothetical protein